MLYTPITTFHIKEITPANNAAITCTFLSDSKYFGFNPTAPRDIDDKNGRN